MNNPVNAVDPSELMMVLLDDDDRRGGGGGRIGFVNLNAGIMTGVTGNEFDLMNIPVTVETWGWIPITPDTTGFSGATSPIGIVTNLAYFGLTSTVVGSGFDLFFHNFNVTLRMPSAPNETPEHAFNRLYPDPTAPPTAANNGGWFQNAVNYLKNHPVFVSVNEILAAQITYQHSTKTLCANVGLGASVLPSKAITMGGSRTLLRERRRTHRRASQSMSLSGPPRA